MNLLVFLEQHEILASEVTFLTLSVGLQKLVIFFFSQLLNGKFEFRCGCYALLVLYFVVSLLFISKTIRLLSMLKSFALFWFYLMRLSSSWILLSNYFKDFFTLNRPFLQKLKFFGAGSWFCVVISFKAIICFTVLIFLNY